MHAYRSKKEKKLQQATDKEKIRCLLGRFKKQVTDKKNWVSNRNIKKQVTVVKKKKIGCLPGRLKKRMTG